MVLNALQRDKEINLENQLKELEIANNKREYGTTWKIINRISNKTEKNQNRVRRLDGSIPAKQEDLIEDWRKYFDKLLNNPNIKPTGTYPNPNADLADIITTYITREEVVLA
ncbi:unnamed protein product, partial [Brachionus calyciflorus]